MILDTLSHHLDAYKNTGGCPAEITYHGLFKSDKSGNLEEQVTLIKGSESVISENETECQHQKAD